MEKYMSFNPSNLVLAWSGNGRSGTAGNGFLYHADPTHPTIWTYDAGTDELSDIENNSPYYFSPDPVALRGGDLLFVTADDGKAMYRVEIVKNVFTQTVGGAGLGLIKLANVDSFVTDYNLFRAG